MRNKKSVGLEGHHGTHTQVTLLSISRRIGRVFCTLPWGTFEAAFEFTQLT